MPFITIEVLEGKTIEQKRKAVKLVTEAMVEAFDSDPQKTWIKINEIPRTNFSTNATLKSDQENK